MLRLRCLKHRAVPAYNASLLNGGECPVCAVVGSASPLDADYARPNAFLEPYVQRIVAFFRSSGNDDREDVPTILKAFERAVRQDEGATVAPPSASRAEGSASPAGRLTFDPMLVAEVMDYLAAFLRISPPSMTVPYPPGDYDEWRIIRKSGSYAIGRLEEAFGVPIGESDQLGARKIAEAIRASGVVASPAGETRLRARRVYQTTFGGPDDPIEEQGNCMQAALATLLGLPLEEAFDFRREYFDWKENRGAHWWSRFERWCSERGWYPLILTHPIPALGMPGVASRNLFDADGTPLTHQVLAFNREVVHDPRTPGGEESYDAEVLKEGESEEWYYLVPIDPVPSDPLPALAHRPHIKARAALAEPVEET